MPRYSYGDDLKERTWNLLDALLSQVNAELEGRAAVEGVLLKPSWQKGNSDRPTLEVKAQLADLSKLSKLSKGKLSIDDVRDALRHYLPEFLGILEDKRERKQGKGSENWHFILTLWSTELQENQKQFNAVWQGKKSRETDVPDVPPNSTTNDNWHNICRTSLEKQKQLTTNRLMSAKQMRFDINQICVDLALVERKQPDKRSGDDNPEQSQLYKPDYEETQKLEYEEFLATVLKASPSNKIAVIGEPGAGKTTLLQRIAFWILDKTDGLPIWIPLGTLPTPAPKLKDYLLNNWLEDAVLNVTPKIRAEFEGLLTAGRVWLLLDGVDEMVANSGNPLSFIDNWIPGWSQQLSVVLTCRLNVWEANPHALNNFQTYRTLEFSQEKVNEFIEACFQNRRGAKPCAPTLGEQLQQALNQPGKERIKDLMRNPLRLTLLCSTWHLRDGKLPDTKAELYQQYVEEVYRWKEDEFPTTPEERKQLNGKLKELALAAIDKEENRFCLRHKFVEGVLGERDGSVFQLALNIGWLNRVGVDAKNPNPNQPIYAFFHPTFQEYFAALAIADWDFFLPRAHDNHNPKPVSERYRIFEPQWKEVILLWLGREEVVRDQFIQALVEFNDGIEYEFYGYRAYFLAAAGIAEFRDCSWADEIVAQIVQWSFGGFDIEKQEWVTFIEPLAKGAMATLSQTDCGRVIDKLIDLFKSTENEFARRMAAYSLGKIATGNQRAIDALVQILETTDNYDVRRIAVELLGKIARGNQGAIEALLQILETSENDENKYIRRRAVERLGEISTGNQRAIEVFLRILETAENYDARRRAAEILGKIARENQGAIEALVRILETTHNEVTRRRAVQILGKICMGNPREIDALVRILETTHNDDTRCSTVELLGKICTGNQGAIETLVRILETTHNDDTRCSTVELLGKICTGNQGAINALIRILETTHNDDTRCSAVKLLGKIGTGNQGAIEALIRILETTQDYNIWRSAVELLGKIGTKNQGAIEALVRILETTGNEDSRRIAAESLVEICTGNQGKINALRRIDARRICIEILGEIGPENQGGIEALVRILETTENYDTRRIAVELLGEISKGDQGGIDALVQILETTENSCTRRIAVELLGKIGTGSQGEIEALLRILETTEDKYILRSVVELLGKIGTGNQGAIDALVRILETTQNEDIRRSAAYRLREILQKDQMLSVISELQHCLDDKVYQTNFDRFSKCYNLIWHCAQNMTYPAFYQAWHQQEKVARTTTPDSQSLNQAGLP